MRRNWPNIASMATCVCVCVCVCVCSLFSRVIPFRIYTHVHSLQLV